MNASSIKSNLRRSGFVFTDLDDGTRITARGPQSPSTEGRAGERDTVVRVQKDGETLHESTHTNHGTAANKYVQLADEHG